jgi:hypothetical protein
MTGELEATNMAPLGEGSPPVSHTDQANLREE